MLFRSLSGVVIDGGALQDVDLMGCETLSELYGALEERGIRLVFGDLRDRVRRDIERGLQIANDANQHVAFASVAAAAAAVGAKGLS